MIQIRDAKIPKELVNCESCGSHGDDMKSIFIFQTVNGNGKMFRGGKHKGSEAVQNMQNRNEQAVKRAIGVPT